MTNSVIPGAAGQANHTISLLRADSREGPLRSDVAFLPGLALHADPVLELKGTFRSPQGLVLELDTRTGTGAGGWLGLHLDLPARDLRRSGVLGIIARCAAPEVLVARACLRSGTDEGFVDCFFDKHLLMGPEEAGHMDALWLSGHDAIPPQAPWRELIVFFPTQSFRMSLNDLRVFIA